MSFDVERLYELLPVLYRIRDNQQGGALKALLSVIAEQVAVLEEDLSQLYDDQFIETCAEWVVPYIGDLIGTRGLFVFPDATFSQRAQVANTLAYRRRKGTAAVLEQLARDVTQWDASVAEYFQQLATTQYLNHLRPENISMMSLRSRPFAGLIKPQTEEDSSEADRRHWETLERLNTPFDKSARTVDVRRIESGRGKYNIPNVGIFLWRIGSYSITNAPAFKLDDRRYLFNALGKDTPLYNQPEAEEEITHLAEPVHVPMPISRRVLDHYLNTYYGTDQKGAVKSMIIKKDNKYILPAETSPPDASPLLEKLSDLISACDLSDVKDAGGNVIGWVHKPQEKIAIDPVLGRIAFPENLPPPVDVHVTYHYGFSAAMGGGEYGRTNTFESELKDVKSVPSDKTTIQQALNEIVTAGGVVEITDNEYYMETPIINVCAGTPEGKKIELRAADKQRPVLVPDGDMVIWGGENAEVTINGLIISGGRLWVPLTFNGEVNELRVLRLRHCTLLPGPSPAIKGVAAQPGVHRLSVETPNLKIEIEHCIVGGLRVAEGAEVRITNSIIDAVDETETAYAGLNDSEAGGTLEIVNSTVIGKVSTSVMKLASNTIFFAPVRAQRLQEGCVRFSYVSPGSHVPRQYYCRPINDEESGRVRPIFTSLRYGDAGYCQLGTLCAAEIKQGADDGAEMGAFHNLYQPQREANLRTRLKEYLRFGLETGIRYAS